MKRIMAFAFAFFLLLPFGYAATRSDNPAQNTHGPLYVGLLIQDNLPNVTTDTNVYREFIRSLPKGTHVAVAYARPGSNDLAVPFTEDLEKAASEFRAPAGFAQMAPGSPFIAAKEFMKKFPADTNAQRVLIFVSDGIDSNFGDLSTPYEGNPYLTSAVSTAKKDNIRVDTIFAPSFRTRGSFRTSVGQGTLNYLSQKTGGVGYYSGSIYVSAQPFLEKILKQINP